MTIRNGELKDLDDIFYIYNQAVENTTATLDTTKKNYTSQLEWFNKHDENYPIFVYEENEMVVGWASLSPWSPKIGYKYTVEISIYVHENHRSIGIGKALIERIINFSIEKGDIHTIISRIAGDNSASIKLHTKYGFSSIGTMKEVGYKFNRFIDVHLYQLIF